MSQLIPLKGGSNPLLPDRQLRKNLEAIDRQATQIEMAAARKMQLASQLNQAAKLHIVAAVGFSRQLKEFAPEAGALLDGLDLQTAQSLSETLAKAVQ